MRYFRWLFPLVLIGLVVIACAAPTAAPAPTQAPAAPQPTAAAPQPTTAAPATQAPAPATQAPATQAPPAAAPLTIKIAITDPCGQANFMDPLNQPGAECSITTDQVYESLTYPDSKLVVQPQLAESWEKNADATQWTFHLRKGVKFHDGHELTSKDVVWTFHRVLDPKKVGDPVGASEGAAQLGFLDYDGITGPDPYTVVFKTPNPVAELPLLISIKNTRIIPDGAKAADIQLHGDGTGPFMAKDWQPVQTPHVFVKNPNYWQPGVPKADRLEMYTITEATTRAAALQSGQVDLVEVVDFASLDALKKDTNIKLLTSGPSTTMLLTMWTDTPPFNDNNVRQALKLVYSKKAVVDNCWLGYGVIGDDNPINPFSPFAWRPASQVPDRDVAQAQALLAKAGYTAAKPLKVDLYTSDNLPGFVCFAQLFAQQAKDAGVQVNVIQGPAAEYWDNVWLKQPFMVSAHVQRAPGEAIGLSFPTTSKYPETHWNQPAFDAALKQANTEPDDAKRLAAYQGLEKTINQTGGDIFEGAVFTIAAIRTNCTGYTPHIQISRFDTRQLTCTR